MKKQMQNNIDISTNTYLNSYKCKQGDIIKWIVDLSDLGASVDLTGRTVICNIVKANNTFLKQTSGITITGSKIDITLDQQATQIPGQTKLSITISKTGEKATTFSKVLEVEKNDTEDLIPSSNIVTIIDQLDAKILEADTIKKALDTSIANGNVAKIRADVDKNTTDIATNKTNITKNTTDIAKNTNDITFLSADIYNAKEGEQTLTANIIKKATKTYVDAELLKKASLPTKPVKEIIAKTYRFMNTTREVQITINRFPGSSLIMQSFFIKVPINSQWATVNLATSFTNKYYSVFTTGSLVTNSGVVIRDVLSEITASDGNELATIHEKNICSFIVKPINSSDNLNVEKGIHVQLLGEELI